MPSVSSMRQGCSSCGVDCKVTIDNISLLKTLSYSICATFDSIDAEFLKVLEFL